MVENATPKATKPQKESSLTAGDKKWLEAQAAKMPKLRADQLKRIGAIIGAAPRANGQD